MSLIHKYIFTNTLIASLAAVLMFASILLIGEVLRDLLGLVAEGQVSLRIFAKLTLVIAPYVFVHALPMGFLTGILLTMGRLSSASEIVALRASGVSISRLSSSVLALAVLGSVIAFVVNFDYGPKARGEYRRELADAVRLNPLGFLVEQTFVKDFPGYVVYVGDKEGPELNDLKVWVLDEEKRVVRSIRARSGNFEYDLSGSMLKLVLRQGSYQRMNEEDPENYRNIQGELSFEKTSLLLPLDRIVGAATHKKQHYWMTFSELQQERARLEGQIVAGSSEDLKETKTKLAQVRMTFHEKFAMGFSVLSFALIGIPCGIVTRRKETSANLFVAIGLGLIYYAMMMAIGWLGQRLGAGMELLYWIPNFIYQGTGLFLVCRIDGRFLKPVGEPDLRSDTKPTHNWVKRTLRGAT